MMGRRQALKGGDEWDVASRNARRVVNMPRGFTRQVKRKMNKRERKAGTGARSATKGNRTRCPGGCRY